MSWKDVLDIVSEAETDEPAIALAERGFDLSPRLHALVAAETALREGAAAHAHFHRPDGTPKPITWPDCPPEEKTMHSSRLPVGV